MQFSYLEGLRRAEREGIITRSPAETYEDLHACAPPLGSLGHFNTRGLDNAGIMLAALTKELPHARSLILGAGAGIVCDDIKTIAPDMHVEAVSLSSFNPFVRILMRNHDIYTKVVEIIGQESLIRKRKGTIYDTHHQTKREEYQKMSTAEYDRFYTVFGRDPLNETESHVPTALVETLQAFEPLNSPACDKLHIAHFPDEFATTEQYDLIYEDRGPLYYVDPEKRGTERDATKHAVELLSPQGVLYATHHDPIHGRAMDIREIMKATIADAVIVQGSPGLLVVREKHMLHSKLQNYIDNERLEVEGGVVHLVHQTIENFLHEAIPPLPSKQSRHRA